MLIGSNGEKLGLVSISDGLEQAKQANIDLVQVSPKGASPVVCKLMDYGKHLFAKKKTRLVGRKHLPPHIVLD